MADLPNDLSFTHYAVLEGTPIPTQADADALRQAVNSMSNWKAVLLANGEPHDKYDADVLKARTALAHLELFVEGRYDW